MPAKWFICPDQEKVEIRGPEGCLENCRMEKRCMFLPTLRQIAEGIAPRRLEGYSVTELIKGAREVILARTHDFAVNPRDQRFLYSMHGSALHVVNTKHSQGQILVEERLRQGKISGQFDLFGEVLAPGRKTMGDIKFTGSYKVTKARGMYQVEIPTGEVFKSGPRKGLPKTRKEWRHGGVRDVLDWAIQLSIYGMFVEEEIDFKPDDYAIQAMIRDCSLAVASNREVYEAIELIPINPISHHWLKKFMAMKVAQLEEYESAGVIPPVCNRRTRWGDTKCLKGFCDGAQFCDHAQKLLHQEELRRQVKAEEKAEREAKREKAAEPIAACGDDCEKKSPAEKKPRKPRKKSAKAPAAVSLSVDEILAS